MTLARLLATAGPELVGQIVDYIQGRTDDAPVELLKLSGTEANTLAVARAHARAAKPDPG